MKICFLDSQHKFKSRTWIETEVRYGIRLDIPQNGYLESTRFNCEAVSIYGLYEPIYDITDRVRQYCFKCVKPVKWVHAKENVLRT